MNDEPTPQILVNKGGPRIAIVCLATVAVFFLVIMAIPYNHQTNRLGLTAAGIALALPWALLALRARRLGIITMTPAHLSYPTILGSQEIGWGDIDSVDLTTISGEGVAMRRVSITLKNGKHRLPAGFSAMRDGAELQEVVSTLERARNRYAS